MSPCCDLFSLPMLGNIIQNFASLLIIGSTGGVLLVILAWFRYRLENNFSLLSVVRGSLCSCGCLDKPSVRSRLDSLSSVVAQPSGPPRSRARTWSDAIMARLYHTNRFSSPPPAYEHPPDYQVALQVETQAEKPPSYSYSYSYSPQETLV